MTIRQTPKAGHRFSNRIEPLEQRIAPATFIVTTVADSGAGSLRQAILSANGSAGADLITFNLGTGPFKILPLTPLPNVTEAVTIDGYSQSGASVNSLPDGTNANIVVELSGASLPNGNGLILGGSGGSIVRGLAIFGFGSGINETGNGIILKSSNNRIEGNFIGTDASGTGTASNENKNAAVRVGDFLASTPIYSGNMIGGTNLADRNLLTGNAFGVQVDDQSSGTQILGNLIGLNKSGTTAYGNFQSGVADSGSVNTQIGNGTPSGRNVISGNINAGVLQGNGTGIQIRGNYIGTNAAGTAALGNLRAGVEINYSGSNGLIEGNVISGNGDGGIHLGSSVGDGDALNFNVRGNFIGTNPTGMLPIPNVGAGVAFFQFADGNTIGGTSAGQGNVIAFNGGPGIEAFGGGAGNRFLGNSISKNGGLGISQGGMTENFFGVTLNDSPDVDGVTNWPQLQTASNSGSSISLNGVLNAQANRMYRVEFFALAPDQTDPSGYGEGAVYLGFQDVTSNASGVATITYSQTVSLPGNTVFSATATPTVGGSTSEFGPVAGASTTYTWIGTAATDWFSPSNWTPNGVPGVLDIANIGSGSVVPTSPVSVKALNFTGGSLGGTSVVNVLGTLSWSGGNHLDGTLRVIDGATATIGGSGSPVVWTNGTLENHGSLTVQAQGVNFNQGVLTNASPNALMTLLAAVNDADGGATAVSLTNQGTIQKQGTGAFGFGGFSVSNAGTLRAQAGTLVVGAIQQTSGLTELAGGSITSAGTVQILGGDLVGAGTITGNVQNDSRIFIAGKDAAGTLTIAGNYTQFSNGVLVVDLGGLTPGAGHDKLTVTGSATLSGTLETNLLGTFVVRAGNSFNILAGTPVIGTFTNRVGAPPIPVNYTAADVTLNAGGFTVTNTNDSGAGSLRQAILDANAQSGLDYISFNIPGGGLKTISPLTVLPSLSGDTVLDAYSQPGASVNTLAVGSNAVLLVELSGASVPNGAGSENGFSVSSSKSTISGFIINRWTGYGVAIAPDAGGSSIVGNWIGTNSTGNAAPVNSQFGILIDSAPDVRIGSAAPRDRNVISGNDGNGIEINGGASDGTIIQGNYIGTTKTGASLLGNRFDGVYTQGPNTLIGGDKPGEGNVISGSVNSVGILINLASAAGSSVIGNLIGADVGGTLDFGNADFGVEVVGTPNVTIGGQSPGAGNVIVGNGSAGISIEGAGSTGAVIEGNYIGTDKAGALPLGNDSGILIYQSSGATVGGIQPAAGNVIANNLGRGIEVNSAAGTAAGNTIRGNAMYGNGALGIDLVAVGDLPNGITPNDALDADTGANGLVNFPTLSTFISGGNPTVTGTYSGLASSSFNIDVYSSNTADPSGNGEGRYFLGTVFVTTNASGTATFTVPLSGFIPGGGVLTATATHGGTGSTSEFSPALATVVSTIRTWDAGGGADTNWFNALNWSGDVVPGAGDSAELLSNFTVTLNAPVTIANFTQADGTVTGGGSMTITSGFTWTKGTFTGPSTLTIAAGATATLSGANPKVLDRRFLDNQGTVLISGTGALQFKNGPLFTNSGVLEFQSDSNYQALDAIGATFTNSGSVRKTGGTGSSTIGLGATTLTINNTGTFDAESGILGIAGGGTFSNATLITKPGTSLRFGGGTTVANGTTTISGDGTLVLSGHTLNVSGTVNQNGATSLSLGNGAAITSSGTWQIGGDGGIASGGGAVSSFTIGAGGVFRKSGGNGISIIAVPLNHTDGSDLVTDIAVTSGTLRLSGGGTWDGTDPDVSAGATMEISGGTLSILNRQVYVNGSGAVRMTGGTLALVSNSFYVGSSNSFELSGGLVNAQSSEELLTYGPTVWSGGDINSSDTGSGFQSYGSMVISGAANRSLRGSLYAYGATTLSMTGAIQLVDDSAVYTYAVTTISGDGDFTHVGTATAYFANLGNGSTNGILRKTDAGTTSFAAGIEFSASGRLELSAGAIATTDLAYLLGTTVLQGGTMTAAGGLELSASVSPGREGILTGTGLITGNFTNLSGTIRPGGTGVAGTITIAGNYTQNAAAKLSVDVGGAGAGQFDVLSVTGTANIDGLLDVAYFNGYVPAFGDTLSIVPSAARTGTFASISGAGLLTAAYTATQARLVRNAVSFAWDGGAGTSDWFTPQNWNPDFVPTANDNVSLSINSTINLATNTTVGTFTQTGGTLTGSATLTVQTALNWTGGTESGAGETTLASGGSGTIGGTIVLSNRTLNNSGTLVWTTGGALSATSSPAFNNLATGVLDLRADAAIQFGGSGGNIIFTNAGTVQKTAGVGAFTFATQNFVNTGTVRVASGTIAFPNAVAAGGTFEATTGALTLTGTTTIETNVTFNGVELAGGVIRGTGTVTGSWTWSSGTLGGDTGALTIPASGVLTLTGVANKSLTDYMVVNNGRVNFSGTGELLSTNSPIFNNTATGVFEIQNDASVRFGGSGGDLVFNNSGTVRKTAGGGTSSFHPGTLNNVASGTVLAQIGRINLPGDVNTAGILSATTGTLTLTGTTTISGTPTFDNIELAGGVIRGTGTVTGSWTWSSGTLGAGGTLTIPVGGVLTLTGVANKSLTNYSVVNNGRVNFSGTGELLSTNSPIFNNTAAGIFDIQTDADVVFGGSGGNLTFNNDGLVRKTVGTGTTNVAPVTFVNNATGVVLAQTGTINFPGAVNAGGIFTAAGGTVTLNGATTLASSVTFNAVELAGGSISGTGTVNGNWTWSAGTLGGGNGTLTIPGTSTVTLAGTADKTLNSYTLTNNGTVVFTGTGRLLSVSSPTFNNAITGVFDLKTDAAVTFGGSGGDLVFNNSGTVRKTAGGGTSSFHPGTLNNAAGGTVLAQIGVINLPGNVTTAGILSATAGQITLAGTTTISGTPTFDNIDFVSGTLNGTGTVAGTWRWSGGSISSGTVTIPAGGIVNVIGANSKTLNNATIENNGLFTHNGSGSVLSVSSPVFNNLAGGVYDLQDDSSLIFGGAGGNLLFNNLGLVRKSGGLFTSTINAGNFVNSGTVHAQSGTLNFPAAVSAGGTFLADAGKSLTFTGTATLSPNVAFNNIDFTGGTLMGTGTVTGSWRWNSGAISGAALTIPAGGVLSLTGAADKTLSSSTIDNSGTIQLGSTGRLLSNSSPVLNNLAGGVFDLQSDTSLLFGGSGGNLTFHNFGTLKKSAGAGVSSIATLNFLNEPTGLVTAQTGTINFPGAVNAGGIFTAAGGAVTLNGATTLASSVTFNAVELAGGSISGTGTVNGNWTWSAGTLGGGNGTLTIPGTSTVTLAGTADKTLNSYTLTNNGTVVVTGTGRLLSVSSPTFNNAITGVFDLKTDAAVTFGGSGGNLAFNNSGIVQKTAGGGTTSFAPGALTNAAGGLILAQTGVIDLPGSVSAGGTFSATTGSLTLTGTTTLTPNVTFSNIDFLSGAMTGTGTVAGDWRWSGGSLSGAALTLASGSTLNVIGGTQKNFSNSTLNNAGNLVVSGTGALLSTSSPTLNNLGTGLVDLQTDTSFAFGGSGGNLTLNNAGTLRKSAGAGTSSIAGTFNNTGSVLAQTGTLNLGTGFNQTAGTTSLAGGALAGGTLTFAGGELRGDGTITGSVNNTGAVIRPGTVGDRTGTLSIVGNFVQGAGGTLAIDIEGIGAGDFDVFNLMGASTLGGGLSVDLVAPFKLLTGHTFRVVTGSPSGDFATFTGDVSLLSEAVDASGVLLSSTILTYVWDAGAGADTSWFNPLNWDRNSGVPTAADTAILDMAATITLPNSTSVGTFQQSAGTFTFNNVLTVLEGFDWTGGLVGGTSALNLASGSTSTLGGAAVKTFTSGTFAIDGTLTWTGSGALDAAGGGQLIVQTGGLFDLQSDAPLTNSAAGFNFTLSIDGTLRKSAGTGTSRIDGAPGTVATLVNPTGQVDVESGTLAIGDFFVNNGTMSALVGTLEIAAVDFNDAGTYNAAAGARVLFSSGTRTLDPGAALTGPGLFEITDGGLDLNTNIAVQNFALNGSSGSIAGAGTLVVSQFDWSSGTMMGFGETVVQLGGVATVTGVGTKNLESRTLTVDAGAALDVTGDGTLQFSNGAAILVDGALTISSAAPFLNGGGSLSSIEIRSVGTFDKTGAGMVDLDVPFVNAGSATFLGGLVNFRATYTQTGGFTALAGGAVGFNNPAEFQGGTLRGSGDITGSINNTGAIVSPGNSPGQFVIEGDYIQGPSGLLRIEIQGSSPGAYDALMISGSASIDGDLEVTVGGISPLPGQTFTFISAASVSGTFSSVTLPSTLKTIYAANAVSVRAPFLPPGLIRLSDLNGTDGLAIPGLNVGGNTGASVAGLGDINGDGLGDFVIGAPGETLGGVSYVIFGTADPLGTPFDLATLNGTNGFSIVGGANSSNSGFSVSSLGDLNGDGLNEILVGDPESGGAGGNVAAAYVVFGKTTAFASTLDLSLLDGTNGFRMVGVVTANDDRISVASAGDLNNDGAADLIVGMPDADFNGTDSGVIYVVFGIGDPQVQYAPSFDLAVLDGTNGFRILGQAAGDAFGAAVSTARDINRDGFGDIIIGAPEADGIAGADSGAAYVFFGKNDGYSATIDLASLNGKTGFKIEGKAAGEKLGSSVSSAGDMNGDGFGDIVVGAVDASKSGVAYVGFGKAGGFKPVLDLSKLTGANGFRLTTASEAGTNVAPRVGSVGDFNNDGFDDILIGTPLPDGGAGVTYLMFGRSNGFAPDLNLETLNATTGFRFSGAVANSESGASVSGGTDINNDGFDDIIIGAPARGNESLAPGLGGAYVIYGHATRAIPTVSASGTSATFSDVDGDTITVKVTGGKITADMLVFGPNGGLLLVDLTAADTLKDGANLTFSVRKNGGDGIVNVGAIDAEGLRLGAVKITGDLGQIDAGKGDPLKPALKSLTVGSLGALGDTTQIPGTEDPLVSDLLGSMPKVTVKGNFTNATFNVLGKLGSMTVNGAFSGTGAFSASQLAGLAALGHGQIGHVAGGTTLASSGLSAGSIGSLNIKGGVTNSAINSASGIGSASITGDFNRSAIVAATSLGVVKVVGKLIGDATTPSVISARGKLNPTSQGASTAINSLTVRGDVDHAEILIGYDRTFTALNGDASIGKVTVNGAWTASSLVAGIKDDPADGFGVNDVRIGATGPDPTPKIISRIASLIIKGTAEGSDVAGESFGITAQSIAKAKINGVKVLLDKLLPDDLLIGTKGNFHLIEVL